MTWVRIDGFARYSVSIDGAIRNDRTNRYMKYSTGIGSGLQVNLIDDFGSSRTVSVPKLVWNTFVGDVPDGMTIVYADGDPHNVDLKNLELSTRTRVVRKIRDLTTGRLYDNASDAARHLGVSPGQVLYAVRSGRLIQGRKFLFVR